MDLGVRLLRGISGWLQFEFQCHRSHVFSEKYLAVPIGQMLSSYYGTQVYAEVRHPQLAPVMVGPGRRPEVDFAVLDPHPKFKVAIETKWYGDTPVTLEDATWDIIRLSLIHYNNPECKCYFVLGGKKGQIDTLFNTVGFSCQRPTRAESPIVPERPLMKPRIRLDNPWPYQAKMFRTLFTKYQDVVFPAHIKACHIGRMPSDCAKYEYQIAVWSVVSAKVKAFRPRNHKLYR